MRALTAVAPAVAAPSDAALLRRLWPLLAAAFVQSLPFTAASVFAGAIAQELGTSVAVVGGARGLGGLSALLVGALVAPLVDRLPRAWAVTAGLGLVAVASLVAAAGTFPALMGFYLLAGAAGAVLQPALQAAGGDGVPGAVGARAAALLTAALGLAAVLAGPALAVPAAVWGWRGDFLAVAAAATGVAAVAARRLSHAPPVGVVRAEYREAFRRVAGAPGAAALLAGSTARAALFFGWLTYVAAYFTERFGATSSALAGVWAVGGGAYVLGTLLPGRLAPRGAAGGAGAAWRQPERLLLASLLSTAVTAPALFLAPSPPAALALTLLHGLGQGVAAASTLGLLIGRYAPLRGAVLALNAAGTNLGAFAGPAPAGAALAAGGYPGLAATVGGLALLAAAAGLSARTRARWRELSG